MTFLRPFMTSLLHFPRNGSILKMTVYLCNKAERDFRDTMDAANKLFDDYYASKEKNKNTITEE